MRQKNVRLSKDEKALLSDIQSRYFGGEETPYGHVIAELCRFWESEHRTSNVKI